MPTPTAPAPARRSSSRRSYLPSRWLGSSELAIDPPFSALLAECPTGKSRDEAVEKRVVEERQRDARDQCGDHDRAPIRQVAANQIRVDAGRHHLVRRRRDEGERVEELVRDERER